MKWVDRAEARKKSGEPGLGSRGGAASERAPLLLERRLALRLSATSS